MEHDPAIAGLYARVAPRRPSRPPSVQPYHGRRLPRRRSAGRHRPPSARADDASAGASMYTGGLIDADDDAATTSTTGDGSEG